MKHYWLVTDANIVFIMNDDFNSGFFLIHGALL